MAAQIAPALGEHRMQLFSLQVEGNQDGGVAPAGDVERGRLCRIEQGVLKTVEEGPTGASGRIRTDRTRGQVGRSSVGRGQTASSTRSTRSWNITSPSSVRWTGHLAAITL